MGRIDTEHLGQYAFGVSIALLSGVIGSNAVPALVATFADGVSLQPVAGLVIGAGLAAMVAARTHLFDFSCVSLLVASGILSGGLFRLTEDDLGVAPSAWLALTAGILAAAVGLAVVVVLSLATAGSWQPAALVPRPWRQSLGATIGVLGLVVVSVVIAGSGSLTAVGWVGWVTLVAAAALLGVSTLWTRRMGWSPWLAAASVMTLAGLLLLVAV